MTKKIGLRRFSNYTGNPVETMLIITSVVVGTIAALAWRDYTESIFEKYFGKNDPVRSRFWYALGVTIGVVIIIYILGRIAEGRDIRLKMMVPGIQSAN